MTTHCKRTASLRPRLSRALTAGAVASLLALGATDAGASTRSGIKSPGPPLNTSPTELAAALSCPQGVKGKRNPVLLVPGAGGEPGYVFSAGLEPVLHADRYPACTVTMPEAGMGDLQIEAEYLV